VAGSRFGPLSRVVPCVSDGSRPINLGRHGSPRSVAGTKVAARSMVSVL
jgi:hypothetical protein